VTFYEQLRSTFRIGLGVLVTSTLLFIAMYWAKSEGRLALGDTLFIVAVVVLALAILTWIPGLVGRSAHRWMWFNVITRSEKTVFGRTVAQRMLESPASPVLRLWLHIDPEGNDRDGSS
jgi:hypothetical protein